MAMSYEQIATRTASEIGRIFRAGLGNPIDLTEFLLERIDKTANSNTFITVTHERARAEAKASAARHAKGRPLSALDGAPIAWKDLFGVAGTRTTAASSLFREAPIQDRDLICVANAAVAGMVCLGKLNMTEFAYSGLGLNPHFGTALNPNDMAVPRSPGGSSSGSGTAVAAGLTPCAIGTDTGGSVRIPASFNGVYGFKTSQGRINNTGMMPLSRTLDTVGPLARSVEDCIVLDMILRGAATTDVRRQFLKQLRIIVPQNQVLENCEPAVLENFETSVRLLEKAGAKIERRHVPEIDEVVTLTAAHGTLAAAESFHEYHDLVASEKGQKIDPRVVFRIMQGAEMSAHDLLCIHETRLSTQQSLAVALAGAVLAMPTTPITAPEIAPLDADPDLFHKVNLHVLRNTAIGSFLGICGLAIPNGRDQKGLPTSIMFNAPGGQDDFLLGHGLEIDRVLQDSFDPTWTRI